MRHWDDCCSGVWQSVWVAAVGCWPCLWTYQAVALDCLAQGQDSAGLVTTISISHCHGTYCITTGICVTEMMYFDAWTWENAISVDAFCAFLSITMSHAKVDCHPISVWSLYVLNSTSYGKCRAVFCDQTLLSCGVARKHVLVQSKVGGNKSIIQISLWSLVI